MISDSNLCVGGFSHGGRTSARFLFVFSSLKTPPVIGASAEMGASAQGRELFWPWVSPPQIHTPQEFGSPQAVRQPNDSHPFLHLCRALSAVLHVHQPRGPPAQCSSPRVPVQDAVCRHPRRPPDLVAQRNGSCIRQLIRQIWN